jgi:hypothetical protein
MIAGIMYMVRLDFQGLNIDSFTMSECLVHGWEKGCVSSRMTDCYVTPLRPHPPSLPVLTASKI